jgi:hypothetical protein
MPLLFFTEMGCQPSRWAAYLAVVCTMLPRHLQEAATRALLGLSIALDHPALSSSPQVLCAAAEHVPARPGGRRCSICNTAVVLQP